ncbi:MAG: phosphoribosylformylglycinamidine cyclo-ligase [Myxococcota bacterium]
MSSENYRKAGVNIDEGNAFVKDIAPLVRSTYRSEVMRDIGGFGGMFAIPRDRYKDMVLISSTDGVGTKVKVASMAGVHDTIGIDLVAMCVNDIIVHGAEPLFFLDYYATGRLKREVAVEVLKGIVAGCRQAGCALIGGETAEMPSVYAEDIYDLAGFVVGGVERDRIIDGAAIGFGNVLIGLSSSGLHSNGYSLARRLVFEEAKLSLSDRPEALKGQSVQEVLLTPTRIYVKSLLHVLRDFSVLGMAHITGGGLLENVPRILPPKCQAVIHRGSWPMPAVFPWLQSLGAVSDEEMHRVFNMGLGMVLVVPQAEASELMARLKGLGEQPFLVGEVVRKDASAPPIRLV